MKKKLLIPTLTLFGLTTVSVSAAAITSCSCKPPVETAEIKYDNVTKAGWEVPTTDPKVNPQRIEDATNPFNIHFENTNSELTNKYFKISIVSANDESKVYGWRIVQATTVDAKAVIETSITTTTDLEAGIVVKLEEHSLDHDIKADYKGDTTGWAMIGKVGNQAKIKLTIHCTNTTAGNIKYLYVQNLVATESKPQYAPLKLDTNSVIVETDNKTKKIYFKVSDSYGVGHHIYLYNNAEYTDPYSMTNNENITIYFNVAEAAENCQFQFNTKY